MSFPLSSCCPPPVHPCHSPALSCAVLPLFTSCPPHATPCPYRIHLLSFSCPLPPVDGRGTGGGFEVDMRWTGADRRWTGEDRGGREVHLMTSPCPSRCPSAVHLMSIPPLSSPCPPLSSSCPPPANALSTPCPSTVLPCPPLVYPPSTPCLPLSTSCLPQVLPLSTTCPPPVHLPSTRGGQGRGSGKREDRRRTGGEHGRTGGGMGWTAGRAGGGQGWTAGGRWGD